MKNTFTIKIFYGNNMRSAEIRYYNEIDSIYEFFATHKFLEPFFLNEHDRFGWIRYKQELYLSESESENISVRMIESKFPFGGKIGAIYFQVAIFGEKIYFVNSLTYHFYNVEKLLQSKYYILIFSHGLICIVHPYIYDEKYHEEFLRVSETLKKLPDPSLVEAIKVNLFEMIIKNEN